MTIPTDPLALATLLTIGLAAAVWTYFLLAHQPDQVARREGRPELPIDNPLLRIAIPLARAISPIHAGAATTPAGRKMDRLLARAGRPFGLKVSEFLCLRYVTGVMGLAFGSLVSAVVNGYVDWAWAVLGGVLFAYLPDSQLKQAVETRRIAIFRDLPYVLDILTLSTEAGMDFSSAMGVVVDKGPPGPLIEEFRATHQETQLGKSRGEALKAMAERVELPELTSFILALIQAERLGASVGQVLRIMSEQTRIKRFMLAEELAGRVPVKLMGPLFIFIFPASFIVLFVPIWLQAQSGGLG